VSYPTIDLTGQKFGRLTVLRRADALTSNREVQWICQCSCPKKTICTVRSSNLRRGSTRGCRCNSQRVYRLAGRSRKGQQMAPWYVSWGHMWRRCTDPKNNRYALYGGRGITVCERWRDSALFYADMGERPVGCSLERRDNNGPYAPENCYWATRTQQGRNQRTNRWVTFQNVTLLVTEWPLVLGHSRQVLSYHLCRGHAVEPVLTRWLAGRDLQQLIVAAGVTPKEQEH
jgi:hypothetical protein